MRVLIISQYFYPENFRVNELAEYLSEKKEITVDVLTGYPNYPEGKFYKDFLKDRSKYDSFKKSKIIRIPCLPRGKGSILNLSLNYISFMLSLVFIGIFKIRKKNYDYIITFGTTPITVAIASILIAKIKKSKCILWVLDLWPEILIDLKILKNNFLYKSLKVIVNWIYRKHDIILAQSYSFCDEIKKINKNILYFPSWPESTKELKDNSLNLFENFKKFDKSYKIVFTGNIGQAQGIDNLIKTIKLLEDQNIVFIFVGFGRKLRDVKKNFIKNNIKNAFFLGGYPFDKVDFFLTKADALLLTLSKGESLNKTIPGKFSTYLQYKKPIIGMIDGEVKKYIDEFSLGATLNYEDHYNNADKIKQLTKINFVQNKNIQENCNILLSNEFNKAGILLKFFNILQKNIKIQKLNIIEKISDIPFNKNFVLSGLNLAFLGYYGKKTISIYDNLYCWPDGLFRKIILKKNIKKIPGRDIIQFCKIPKEIKNIIIAGNCSDIAKKKIVSDYREKKINFISLPYSSPFEISRVIPKLNAESILVLTLPTPKQEQVAKILSKRENTFKIFCLGGALEMAFGNEKIPKFFDKEGLEAIYRLRFETYRRLRRFFVTFVYFFISYLKGDYRKINLD